MGYLGLILGALGVILVSTLWRALVALTWKPYATTKKLRKQGVMGPEYKFWSGCLEDIKRLKKEARETELDIHSHDIIPRVLPHYFNWMHQYGRTFLYWEGTIPRLCIADAELAKQILSSKFGFYTKTKPNGNILALLGRGLVLTDGSEWARHRRIISPAFTMDKLKLTMVLFEALRLYCPILMIVREAPKEMNLGSLLIPKGTVLTIPFVVIHRDKELWGDDADEFKPLRFENGITNAAKHPNALLAFSIGPRACIGQNFAMLEAKTVIALILKRFTFSISPEYKHKPADMLTLQPQNGLPIVLNPLVP